MSLIPRIRPECWVRRSHRKSGRIRVVLRIATPKHCVMGCSISELRFNWYWVPIEGIFPARPSTTVSHLKARNPRLARVAMVPCETRPPAFVHEVGTRLFSVSRTLWSESCAGLPCHEKQPGATSGWHDLSSASQGGIIPTRHCHLSCSRTPVQPPI